MEAQNGISIVIPTLNGGDLFSRCLQAIRDQDFDKPVELIVVDSGSSDQTVARAQSAGAKVTRIAPAEFHHADTRNLALRDVRHDNVICMVQDAVPATRAWIGDMYRALHENDVVAAYGRPIPHETASAYGRFTADGVSRYLGSEPLLQSLSGADAYAKMSFDEAYRITRLDNVSAIYRRAALNEHPFPQVPYAEDMAWALEMLLAGDKIMYDPGLVVSHSHERSAADTFRRHVVDAVYCAEILGKLRCDLSAITVDELIDLTSWVESRIKSMCLKAGNLAAPPPTSPPLRLQGNSLFGYLAATNSLGNRNRAQGYSADTGVLQTVGSRLGVEIEYLWKFLKKSYTVDSEGEAADALEKIAASLLGKCYGEVYASCAAMGKLDAKLSDFIEPYIKGI